MLSLPAQLCLLLRLQSTNRISLHFAFTGNHLCAMKSDELGKTAALTILCLLGAEYSTENTFFLPSALHCHSW